MKRFITMSLFALFYFSIFSVQAQDIETRDVGPFDALKVSHGIKVILVEGEEGKIILKSRFFEADDISTQVVAGMLKVKFRTSSLFDFDDMGSGLRRVTVEVPYHGLDYIEATTGALIISDLSIEEEDLILETTMGAEIKLKLDVVDLELDSNMGSIVQLEGSVENLKVKANMGAVIDCRDMESQYVYAKSNMGAEIKVTAVKEADVSAGMGGVIRVYGDPDRQYVSKSLGGEVRIN